MSILGKKKKSDSDIKPFDSQYGLKGESFVIYDQHLRRTIFDDAKASFQFSAFDLSKTMIPSSSRSGSKNSSPVDSMNSVFATDSPNGHQSPKKLTKETRNETNSVIELNSDDKASKRRSQSVDVLDVRDIDALLNKSMQYKQYIEEYYWELFTYILARQQREAKLHSTKWKSNFEKEVITREHEKRETILLRSRRLCGRLHDYHILKRIGKGAFGEVFLVSRKKTKELLALKKIPKTSLDNKNQMEQDVLAEASSQWLVEMSYTFQDSESIYFAMEFIPGGDLRNFLSVAVVLPIEDARFYLSEMLTAVDVLHKLGYIHRDLKPDNFLIDKDGHIKLIDFGLSTKGVLESYSEPFKGQLPVIKFNPPSTNIRREEFKKQRKALYSLVGSPDYMYGVIIGLTFRAYEILAGSGYDFTADWWSLGCILYEMLAGFPPFTADTPRQVFANVLNYPNVLDNPVDDDHPIIPPVAWDLIKNLICAPDRRLGRGGVEEIKEHAFFKDVNWNTLKSNTPPFIPKLNSPDDTSYFEQAEDVNTVQLLYGKSSFAHKMTALPKAIALRLDELTFSKDVLPSASEPGSGRSSPTATIRGSSPGEHSRSSSPTGSVARRNSLSKSNNLPLKFRKDSPASSGSSPRGSLTRRTSLSSLLPGQVIMRFATRASKPLLFDNPSAAQLSLRDWKVLCTGAMRITYPHNAVILPEGSYNTFLFRIKSGVVRFEKNGQDGKPILLGKLEKNQVFGEMAFVEDAWSLESRNEPNVSASVIVDSDQAECYKIDRSFVSYWCDKDLFAKFYYVIDYVLAERAADLPLVVKGDKTKQPKARYPASPKERMKASLESGGEKPVDKEKDKADTKFRKRFHLPAGEYLIRDIKCTMVLSSKKYHGKLYIGKKFFCFHSRIFGYSYKEKIPVQSISHIESVDQELIRITSAGTQHNLQFSSSELRDEALLMMVQLFQTFTQRSAETEEDVLTHRQHRRNSVGMNSTEFINWEEGALMKQLALNQEDWGTILEGAECITFRKEEVAIAQGDVQEKIYQIASGQCRIERFDTGSQQSEIVGYYNEREMFGEVGFLLRNESNASVVADADHVEIYVIDKAYLEKVFAQQPGIAGKFYKFLSLLLARRIRQRELEIQKLARKSMQYVPMDIKEENKEESGK